MKSVQACVNAAASLSPVQDRRKYQYPKAGLRSPNRGGVVENIVHWDVDKSLLPVRCSVDLFLLFALIVLRQR